ncbi:MAG: DsbA family protein [Anaerolineae bacterium]
MINRQLLVVILVLALFLAACMPGSAPRPTASAPTSAVVPSAPTATATAAMIGPTLPTAPAGKARNVPVGVDADGNFYRGNLNAPVKLVEFSDFQCPYCGRHAQQTDPLLEEQYIATGKVVAFFRHFPLSEIHPAALPAARAAYCAGQQAPKWFWAMHDWLFANQNGWANARNAAEQFPRRRSRSAWMAASTMPV